MNTLDRGEARIFNLYMQVINITQWGIFMLNQAEGGGMLNMVN